MGGRIGTHLLLLVVCIRSALWFTAQLHVCRRVHAVGTDCTACTPMCTACGHVLPLLRAPQYR